MELHSEDIIHNHEEIYKELYDYLLLEKREGKFSNYKQEQFKIILKDTTSFNIKAKHLLPSLAILPILLTDSSIEDLKEEYFLTDNNQEVTIDTVNNLIQYLSDLVFDNVEKDILKETITNTISSLSNISVMTNKNIGQTISIYELCQLVEKEPELLECINLDIPEGLQFAEIEELVKNNLNRGLKLIKKHDSCYSRFLNGDAINTKQLGQSLFSIGTKPDLFGNCLEHIVNTSFLKGLRNIDDYVVTCIGSKKALVTNATEVSGSGYFARKLQLLVLGHDLLDIEECDSKHGIKYYIDSEDSLNRLEGRYLIDNTLLDINNKDLVNTEIELRSPAACNASKEIINFILVKEKHVDNNKLLEVLNNIGIYKIYTEYYNTEKRFDYSSYIIINDKYYVYLFDSYNNFENDYRKEYILDELYTLDNVNIKVYNKQIIKKKGICNKCYGKLSSKNKDFHVGLVGVTLLTNILTQRLLSTKHLLQTNSVLVDWCEEFNNILQTDRENIKTNKHLDEIKIAYEDIISLEEHKDEYFTRVFYYKLNEDDEYTKVEVDKELYLNDYTKVNDEEGDLVFKYLNLGDEVFYIKSENIELSTALKNILSLIEKKDHHNLGDEDINAIYSKFIELLNEANLDIMSVHIEIILRGLIVLRDNVLARPDFSDIHFPNIRVLPISTAISKTNLSNSLSFEKIKDQFSSLDTYMKDEVGILDEFYL